MSYNPNQPRDPAGMSTGGQWTSEQADAFDAAMRKGAGLEPKMKNITTICQIVEDAHGKNLYIRWSRGPELDKKQRNSLDQVSGQLHSGLSAQNIRTDNPKLMARMIPEYRFLKRKDNKIYPWIFEGKRIGTDSDDAPLVDADSIVPVGKISDDLLARLISFSQVAAEYDQKFAYNAWRPETIAKNTELQKRYDSAWDALKC